MRKSLLAALLVSMSPVAAKAATVAIIDSGYDHGHEALKGKVWTNAAEIEGDQQDNDGNGKIDDIFGWNFADNSGEIIDYSMQENYTPDIEKFLELQLSALDGTATEGEKIWLKEQLKNADFIKKLQAYGNYAHGTHVAGIVAHDNPKAQLIAVKLISTKSWFKKLKEKVRSSLAAGDDINFIKEFIFKAGLYGFAIQQAKIFDQIGVYMAAHGVQIANGSFGIGMDQARGLVTPILMALVNGQPSEELVDEYASFFVNRIVEEQKKVLNKYPEILFVFAAGNDGADNDELPTAPASVKLDNVITVGASVGNVALAPFSNFGASRVDLFAPGVGIRSSVPRENMYLPFSGTSMAAPEVARLAALVKDKNPELKPKDIRDILMGTIDRKDFLKGRAYTEGVINDERAVLAAEKSLTSDLRKAIQAAKQNVVDKAPQGSFLGADSDFSLVTPF